MHVEACINHNLSIYFLVVVSTFAALVKVSIRAMSMDICVWVCVWPYVFFFFALFLE